mgnify:CR=1 FL=1
MRIVITLPDERKRVQPFDRAQYGALMIVSDDETPVLGPVACLGKGGRSKTALSGNWKLKGMDTPTGEYQGTLAAWTPEETYGPHRVLKLDAVAGNALEAEKLGRSGLAIHGGRDQSILWSTEGCVRVFDRDMFKINEFMNKKKLTQIKVEVKES